MQGTIEIVSREELGTKFSIRFPNIRVIDNSITDINKAYLKQGNLSVSILDRGTAWLDTGTFDSLMQASQFVEVIEERQGLKIGAIEGAAYEMGYINKEQFKALAQPLLKSGYGKNLLGLLNNK